MRPFLLVLPLAMVALTACAPSRVSDLGPDRLRIGEHPAPVCTLLEAEVLALETAAIETLKRGRDGFVITRRQNFSAQPGWRNSATKSHRAVGKSGHIVALDVRMVASEDPAPGKALDARDILGPDWENRVATGAPQECPA